MSSRAVDRRRDPQPLGRPDLLEQFQGARLGCVGRLLAALFVWLVPVCVPAAGGDPAVDVGGAPLASWDKVPASFRRWREGIDLLETSRERSALESFLAAHRKEPGDVCGCYFPAFVYMDFNPQGIPAAEAQTRGRELVEQGIAAGERLVKADAADLSARYCLGALYFNRGRDRAQSRGEWLRGAFDSLRGRRLILDVLEEDPSFLDARLWMGAYDYYAATLPGVVKILQTILFLPGGNRDRGLQTLEEVSRSGAVERMKAFVVLSEIYGTSSADADAASRRSVLERFHETYPDLVWATSWLAESVARTSTPDRPRRLELYRGQIARVASRSFPERDEVLVWLVRRLASALMDDLEPGEAAKALRNIPDGASAKAANDPDWAADLARALNRDGRHDEALGLLDRLRGSAGADPSSLREIEGAVQWFDAAGSSIDHDTLEGRRLGRAGRMEEAAESFRRVLAKWGPRGLIYHRMGEASFEARRFPEATTWFERALALGEIHPDLTPEAHLRLGNIHDLQGDRSQARREYRLAISAAGDGEDGWVRSRANALLKRPFKLPA